MISITIKGLTALEAKLGAGPGKLRERKKRAMHKSVLHLQRRVAKYPPQGSTTYRRTGTLGRGWTTAVASDGSQGLVGNNVRYARYVQGPSQTMQARVMRRKGWKGIDVVAKEEERQVVRFFIEEIGALVKELS